MAVRWGIVGCGSVTEVKSGPGFQSANGSELVAVSRRTPGLAEDYARRHAVRRWYTRAEDLIHDSDVDIVSIATPPSSHCELALQVCAAGKPALVEKPMAMSYAECLRMIEAFEKAGLPLFVAYYRRALPRFRLVRQFIQEGRIGSVRAVLLRNLREPRSFNPDGLPWRVIPEIAGGGYFVDIGSHTLDLVDFLLGPLTEVSGTASNQGSPYPAEDSVSLSFLCGDGVPGTGLWQFGSFCHEDTFEIIGTEGRLTFATLDDAPIRLQTSAGTEDHVVPNPKAVQQPLIQSIVVQLEGGPPCPSTGATAARTTRVMEQVLSGYYARRVR